MGRADYFHPSHLALQHWPPYPSCYSVDVVCSDGVGDIHLTGEHADGGGGGDGDHCSDGSLCEA